MLSRRRFAILAVLLIAFDALNTRQQNRKVVAGGYGDDPDDEKLNFGSGSVRRSCGCSSKLIAGGTHI
jgi:hypothetical protein